MATRKLSNAAPAAGTAAPTDASPEDMAALSLDFGSLSEGGNFLRSFRGRLLKARIVPHRYTSDKPGKDIPKGFMLALRATFEVLEVLDDSGYDKPEFTNTWSLGGKSLFSHVPSADGRTPAGASTADYRFLAEGGDDQTAAELDQEALERGDYEGWCILPYDDQGIIGPRDAERRKGIRPPSQQSNFGELLKSIGLLAPDDLKDERGNFRIGADVRALEGIEGVLETTKITRSGTDASGKKIGDSNVLVMTAWDGYRGRPGRAGGAAQRTTPGTPTLAAPTTTNEAPATAPRQAAPSAVAPTCPTPAATGPTAAPAGDNAALRDEISGKIYAALPDTGSVPINSIIKPIVSTYPPADMATVLMLANEVIRAESPLWRYNPVDSSVSAA